MTVSELVQALSKFSSDTKVVVKGYENGYNDILQIIPVRIMRKKFSRDYDGEYGDSETKNAIVAVNLFGENTNAAGD